MSRAKTPVVDSQQRLRRLLLSLTSEIVLTVITLIPLSLFWFFFFFSLNRRNWIYEYHKTMFLPNTQDRWCKFARDAPITYCNQCIQDPHDIYLRAAHSQRKVSRLFVRLLPSRQPCSVHFWRSACQNVWLSVSGKLVHVLWATRYL